ncbi:MAG: 4-alpha-glucanotransferase [Thermodesulfovibrionia bacterium]|nr:4-alpha-glucanotransferase [Thermodesulfovibrionia bacterium]
MERRGSGILLHITSLPSPYGIGDLGPGAYRFVDFLAETHQSYWQILPLNPTSTVYGNSPYSSFSAFAGNSLFISPELMLQDGIISKADIKHHTVFPNNKVNYNAVVTHKEKILDRAFEKNKNTLKRDYEFTRFCTEHAQWLDDYALFISIKRHFHNVDWGNWPEELRDRSEGTIREWRELFKEMTLKEKFFQHIFFKQWTGLKNYCESKGIRIMGDMPIYVNYDSSDVWANSEIFMLDEKRKPTFVAGVPPDYFSVTGQLWGHPVYNWDMLRQTQYSWWVKRIEHNLKLFHMFRLDHFRGFVAFWQVKAGEKTAINGEWVAAPVKSFFNELFDHFPGLPLIAEDLGVITADVKEIMNQFGFPGMKVLLFAFGENLPTNPYAPHNHVKNCVVYTGTHDNNTAKGWFRNELGTEGRQRLSEYVGRNVSEKTVHWELIRLAMMSVADMVVIPMQDILGLGEKKRMNLPASTSGNWRWRVTPRQLSPSIIKKLSRITRIYGRDK